MDKELESLVEDRVRIVEALRLLYQVGFGENGDQVQETLVTASCSLYKVRDSISAKIKEVCNEL